MVVLRAKAKRKYTHLNPKVFTRRGTRTIADDYAKFTASAHNRNIVEPIAERVRSICRAELSPQRTYSARTRLYDVCTCGVNASASVPFFAKKRRKGETGRRGSFPSLPRLLRNYCGLTRQRQIVGFAIGVSMSGSCLCVNVCLHVSVYLQRVLGELFHSLFRVGRYF